MVFTAWLQSLVYENANETLLKLVGCWNTQSICDMLISHTRLALLPGG